MKIELRSLHVKGCGPLEDVTIDFTDAEGKPRPVTVLAGANGSGKTRILESIFGLAETLEITEPPEDLSSNYFFIDNKRAQKILFDSAFIKAEYLYSNIKFVMELNKGHYPDTPTDQSTSDISWTVDFETAHVAYGSMHGSFEQKISTGNTPSPFLIHFYKDTYLDEFISDPPKNEDAFLPSFLYFPQFRHINSIKGESVTKEKTNYSWVYKYKNSTSYSNSIDAYLIWLDYAKPEQFKSICDFLNKIDLEGKQFSIDREELKVLVTTREDETHYLEDLSAGEQNILIMLLELRRRLLPGSIVLIDEIESSLHEAYQHMLAQALLKLQREIPFQLIVTTHSKTIAKIFGWDSVVILTDF